MSEIKILHLFADLMSLYGEYGNIAILNKYLTDNGHTVSVERTNILPESLEGYSLVYIGSGTEEAVVEACKRLKGARLGINTLWLLTGNAMALLGEKVTYKGEELDGLGVYNFVTDMSHDSRFMGDVMAASAYFAEPTIGYINTSSVYKNCSAEPAFTLTLGAELGNCKQSPADGIMSENLLATQLIGPLLVKNPHLLQWIYKRLTNEELNLSQEDPINMAYKSALSQLEKRM